MAKTNLKSVDEYIASQPEVVQGVLRRVRNAIRKAVPDAEEVISYKIPTYKLHGAPEKLIERIAKFRAKEVAEREKAK
jgi:uncharacterized protein YdhG (YjbR/CyaY superfamily)